MRSRPALRAAEGVQLQARAGVGVDLHADANLAQPRSLPNLHGQLSQSLAIVKSYGVGITDKNYSKDRVSGLPEQSAPAALSFGPRFLRRNAGVIRAHRVHPRKIEPRHLHGEDVDIDGRITQPARLDLEGLALPLVPNPAGDGPGAGNALHLKKMRQLVHQDAGGNRVGAGRQRFVDHDRTVREGESVDLARPAAYPLLQDVVRQRLYMW